MPHWLSRWLSRIDRSARTLHLSQILDWFAEDFGDSVPSFVAAHLSDADAGWIREQGSALRIRYFEYDWSLNDVGSGPLRQPGAVEPLGS